MRGLRTVVGLLLLAAAGAGCSDDDGAADDGGIEDARPDGDVEAGDVAPDVEADAEDVPDTGDGPPGFCDDETRCDDGLECTVDSCDEALDRCSHTPDHSVCQDGLVCNGEEQCQPGVGCATGTRPDCRDDSACTLDSCVEERGGCVHDPRDLDGDTYITDARFGDEECGGDDCNDADASVHPGAVEICDDIRDNDCDTFADFADSTCRPANDSCAGALLLTEGVSVNASTRGTVWDYSLSCSWESSADVVFRIDLTGTRDVIVTVTSTSGGAPYVDFETTCGDGASSLRCTSGSAVTLRRNSLAAGSYWVVVQGTSLDFSIQYTTAGPTPIPANDVCSGATDIPAAGGSVPGSLLDTSNHYSPTCSRGATYPDVFYRLVLAEPKKVTLDLDLRLGDWDDYSYLALTSTCGDPATELACATGDYWSGTQPQIVRNFLDAGTYYVVVDSNVESDFTLSVRFEPPILPPANDRCSGAIDITGGGWFVGAVADTYRDYPPSCSLDPFADVVYSFTTTEPRDVTLRVTPLGADARYVVALRTDCPDGATELGCRAGNPAELIRRSLPAGTYYVIVSGDAAAAGNRFLLEATFGAPTPVPPGDTCADAVDISAGGRFTGTTLACGDDYEPTCAPGVTYYDAVFRFRLAVPRDVTLAVGGSSAAEAYLDLRMGACGTGGTSARCVGARSPSVFSRNLPAGDYWVLVDTSSETAFTLDAAFAEPTSACDSAPVITIDYSGGSSFHTTVTGDTSGRADEFTSECFTWSTAPDQPYQLVVPVRSAVSISSDHTVDYFDGTLYILTDCDLPSSEFDCNDDCPYVGLSCLPGTGGTMTLEAGTYTVIQDGLGSDGGAFTLTVDATRL
ncbi:MAG: putative metal-binding motif-containing protein [Deltaproteobacteria bacterium]|nr:putative metal-binding motif-containing protein [Deltaproteobacteria bacterium]